MTVGGMQRCYLALRATPDLMGVYPQGEVAPILRHLARLIFGQRSLPADAVCGIVDLPSLRFLERAHQEGTRPLDRLVIALMTDEPTQLIIRSVVQQDKAKAIFHGFGVDLPVHGADHWCPAGPANATFADRTRAERLIGVDALPRAGLTGRGVNLVLIDQGVDASRIKNFGGGWRQGNTAPGITKAGHGMDLLRNVVSIAPDVTIYDCPILAPRSSATPHYLSLVDAAYAHMLADINHHRQSGRRIGAWIFVNAWAIFDRRAERPLGDYSNNPDHPFNRLIEQAAAASIDLVFAAGNCGQFCPRTRCGANDRGPGHSILGANSHPLVLTVGAVRSDGLWLGYSSQGPGQSNLTHDKPDICAPSEFRDTEDAFLSNSGTSTSAALAAGVVAALRSRWSEQVMPPDRVRTVLRDTAQKFGRTGWDSRLGYGILDAGEVVKAASATCVKTL